ncbi:MAG: LCP family protein [Micrococcales bacterium]|nr:LCP family protein [Micrococcales bacterium]
MSRPPATPQNGPPVRRSIKGAGPAAPSAVPDAGPPPSFAPRQSVPGRPEPAQAPPRTAGPGRPLDASPARAQIPAQAPALAQQVSSPAQAPPRAKTRSKKRRHPVLRTLAILLVLALAWPVGLGLWANSRLKHVDALSSGQSTSGRTYLVAGSDARGSGGVNDTTEGARADTIMVLHVAPNGQASLVSIPRDTYVNIAGYGGNKINAAYALGGPKLLVQSVEQLTGFHVDHYVEVGFGSVTELVEAVGGVELCLDQDVSDANSKLEWQAGCHQADGPTALAFSRMRYADPLGDIGRVERQRQVVSQVMKRALSASTVLWPPKQVGFVRAGTDALTVDESMNIVSMGRLALDFRKATGPDGAMGTPTIASTNFTPGGIGSAVLLDEAGAAEDFRQIAEGTWKGNKPNA